VAPKSGGILVLDTIEIDAGMFPIFLGSRDVAPGTKGCDQWRGPSAVPTRGEVA
jgi:hypothetical protein